MIAFFITLTPLRPRAAPTRAAEGLKGDAAISTTPLLGE
jgi:hypothetical protein